MIIVLYSPLSTGTQCTVATRHDSGRCSPTPPWVKAMSSWTHSICLIDCAAPTRCRLVASRRWPGLWIEAPPRRPVFPLTFQLMYLGAGQQAAYATQTDKVLTFTSAVLARPVRPRSLPPQPSSPPLLLAGHDDKDCSSLLVMMTKTATKLPATTPSPHSDATPAIVSNSWNGPA